MAIYDGLIHWWGFNETSGTTTYDSVNTGSINGTLSDISLRNASGKNGYCIFPDTYYEKVNFGKTLKLDRGNPFSFSFWVKPYSDNNGRLVSIFNQPYSNPVIGYKIYAGYNEVSLNMRNASYNQSYLTQVTSLTLSSSFFHHIVVTYDGTNAGGIHFYIDGVYNAGTVYDNTLTNSIVNDEDFCIGNYGNTSLGGSIDEVGYWNRVITASEVAELYNSGNGKFFSELYYPTLSTNNVTSIGITTATCGGNITFSGASTVTARGICWSTSPNPTTANSKTTNGSGVGTFTSSMTGLVASTTYYIRAYATNSVGTSYGNQVSFTTLSNLPIITTNYITSITTTGATCGGNITFSGASAVSARGVCWNTTGNPTIANSKTTNGSGVGTFTSSITGLNPSTTYYVRAYATNSYGTSYGQQYIMISKYVCPLTLYTDFGAGFDGIARKMYKSKDNKLFVCGSFGSYKGSTAGKLIKLNLDGSRDTTFDQYLGFDGGVAMVCQDSLQRVYVVGSMNAYHGGAVGGEIPATSGTLYRIASFNSNGSVNTYFSGGTGFAGQYNDITKYTTSIAIDYDDKIYVGGNFISYKDVTQNYLIRLHPNGDKDTAFNIGTGFNAKVNGLRLQSDNKLLVWGDFTMYNGSSCPKLIRLNTDGSIDTGFTFTGAVVTALDLFSDGKILIASRNGYVYSTYRLNTNGTKDNTYYENYHDNYSNGNINYDITALAITSDGKAYVGGRWNYTGILRIDSTGYQDMSFVTSDNVYPFGVQPGFNITNSGDPTAGVEDLTLFCDTNVYVTGNITSWKYGEILHYITSIYPDGDIEAFASVTTAPVSSSVGDTVLVGGEVIDEGGIFSVSERGICWGLSANPTTSSNKVALGSGLGSFSYTITGLSNNTTYHVRAYAINDVGISYGADVSFTTKKAPTVVTYNPTNITWRGAYLHGNVTNVGDWEGAPVENGVCLSLTNNPTINDKIIANPTTGYGAIDINITSLSANTTYYYKAYGTNKYGTGFGSVVSFTTLSASTSTYFISTWDTTKISAGSSVSNQIKLPLVSTGTYNFIVDWGDGQSSTITSYNQAQVTHTYAVSGQYTITIDGTCTGFRFDNSGDRLKILSISQWGSTFKWGNYDNVFNGCQNLNITATDIPNLNGITTFKRLFRDCNSLVYNSSINNWNISNVTVLDEVFYNCYLFNQPLNNWTISSLVTALSGMFYRCYAFNQPLNNWNISNVTNLAYMFYRCYAFNQSLNNWNTGNVTNFNGVFQYCYVFNQPLSNWNTSKVTSMNATFESAYLFNQNLSTWNTSNVGNMYAMFKNAYDFNQDLSSWDVSSLTTATDFLLNGKLSLNNYDATLASWAGQSLKSNVTINFGNSTFCDTISHDYIALTYNWIIIDAGLDFKCQLPKNVTNCYNFGGIKKIWIAKWSSDLDYNFWNQDEFYLISNSVFYESTRINEFLSSSGGTIQWYSLPIAPQLVNFSQNLSIVREGFVLADNLNVAISEANAQKWVKLSTLINPSNKWVYVIQDDNDLYWTGGYLNGAKIDVYNFLTGNRGDNNGYGLTFSTTNGSKLLTSLKTEYVINNIL